MCEADEDDATAALLLMKLHNGYQRKVRATSVPSRGQASEG